MAGRGSFSVSGGTQRRRAHSAATESCVQGWGRLGSLVPAGSMGEGAALPLAQSQSHLLLDTWGMRAEEWPGLSDLPLLVPLCWPGMGRTAARSTPAPHPGLPGGLAQTGRLHCMAGEQLPGPRLPSVQSACRENPGPSGAGSSTARPICRSWCRLGPRPVSTAILLEMGEGNCILSGQQHSRWETDGS